MDKLKDIPVDYTGAMGVPVTFIMKYNKEQFEIIGLGKASLGKSIGVKPFTKEHKEYMKTVKKINPTDGCLYMIKDGVVKIPFNRVLIRKKLF